jgi:hypothetical protein
MQYAVSRSRFTVLPSSFAVLLFAVLQLTSGRLLAQHVMLPTSGENIQLDHYLNHQLALFGRKGNDGVFLERTMFHTSVKPYVNADVFQHAEYIDSLHVAYNTDVLRMSMRFSNFSIYAKRNEELAPDPDREWVFGIKPVYDVSGGFDLKESRLLLNTIGGVRMGADYKQKIGIDLRLVSGGTTLPNYQDSLARHHYFIPGWGDFAQPNRESSYSFSHLTGNIIWRPTRVFNLQVGRDKHFWGDGNRSLFIGDQGPAFPYIKAQTTIWKLQYTSLFAWMRDWSEYGDSNEVIRGKFASFHYLSFNATKWLNISVFEGIVWQGTDANRQRWFDPNYLNPMVFFRPVEYSLGSSDNAMLGIAGKIRFNRNNVLYGQVILDEFYLKEIRNWNAGWWANKQGAQIGYKCFNFAMIDRLYMQTEVNVVRPYTYAHGSPQQSYSNGPLPLAHPMGANFAELMGMLSYNVKGFTVTGQVVGIRYGKDINDTMNYGQNVFQSYVTRESEYGNKVFQGYATNIFLAKINASYVFNTKFPLRLQLTAIARSERTKVVERKLKSSFVMVGLSLPLYRAQDDY